MKATGVKERADTTERGRGGVKPLEGGTTCVRRSRADADSSSWSSLRIRASSLSTCSR